MRCMVSRLRFVLCFLELLSDSDEAVASVLCLFFKIQCEFAVTASYGVNSVHMTWAASTRWYAAAIGGPF